MGGRKAGKGQAVIAGPCLSALSAPRRSSPLLLLSWVAPLFRNWRSFGRPAAGAGGSELGDR